MDVCSAHCEFSDFISGLLCGCLRKPAACSSLAGTSLSLCRFLSLVWGRDVLRPRPVGFIQKLGRRRRGFEFCFFWLENNFRIGSVLKWIPNWQKYNSWGFSGIASSNLPWLLSLYTALLPVSCGCSFHITQFMIFHKGLERWEGPPKWVGNGRLRDGTWRSWDLNLGLSDAESGLFLLH